VPGDIKTFTGSRGATLGKRRRSWGVEQEEGKSDIRLESGQVPAGLLQGRGGGVSWIFHTEFFSGRGMWNRRGRGRKRCVDESKAQERRGGKGEDWRSDGRWEQQQTQEKGRQS